MSLVKAIIYKITCNDKELKYTIDKRLNPLGSQQVAAD